MTEDFAAGFRLLTQRPAGDWINVTNPLTSNREEPIFIGTRVFDGECSVFSRQKGSNL